jgi:hypothetical protein
MRLKHLPHAIILVGLACAATPLVSSSWSATGSAVSADAGAPPAHAAVAVQQFAARTEAVNEKHLATLKSWSVGKTKIEALTQTFDVVDPFFNRLGILTLQKTAGRSVYTIGTYPGTSRTLESSALVAIVRGAQASLERIDKESNGDLRQADGLEANTTCVVEFDATGLLTSIVWQ